MTSIINIEPVVQYFKTTKDKYVHKITKLVNKHNVNFLALRYSYLSKKMKIDADDLQDLSQLKWRIISLRIGLYFETNRNFLAIFLSNPDLESEDDTSSSENEKSSSDNEDASNDSESSDDEATESKKNK